MGADGEERNRVLGMGTGRRSLRVPDTEQRVLGVPISWYSKPDIDGRWLRHPVRWARWRAQMRRLGPYAPDFDEIEPGKRETGTP